MPKPIRGRAGREDRRADQRDSYGADIALLVAKQINVSSTAQVLHLGSPGALTLLPELARRIPEGMITALVYTYDELIETQAAVANFPQVRVINEFEELDPHARFDLATCIIPYNLSNDYVEQLIKTALSQLEKTGVFVMGGDRRHEFERYSIMLAAVANPVTSLANNAHLRIVQVEAKAIRRRGSLIKRP